MSSIEDQINQIGLEQGLKATMNVAQHVAIYYRVLVQTDVPPEVALPLTIAFQQIQYAIAANMTQKPQDEADDDHQ